MLYAITDIETTGSYAEANGITEICIIISDGEQIIERFETLINPKQPIPRYIQAMTGISDAMVASAPEFEEVAEKIFNLFQGKIFVAHNVNFDYSFIKSQLSYCGYDLSIPKLCTVRLSRKLLPGHNSYGLGRLCDALGIVNENRHRAGGDTMVTTILFHQLMQSDREGFIKKSIGRNSKENILPPHVPKSDFDKLPYTPGVYYFKNEKGKIIYIGKAKNIRYRVNSHFSNNSTSRQRQNFLKHTHAIHFESCATELMAHILESVEIKKKWPLFNASQKNRENSFAIVRYEDQKGYLRLAIEKNKSIASTIHMCNDMLTAQSILRTLVKEYQLCPRFCFLQSSRLACDEKSCQGACSGKESIESYNSRVMEAVESLQVKDSFAIIEQGLQSDQRSCILVENGKLIGMGYLSEDEILNDVNHLKRVIEPLRENSYIRNLVFGYALRYPERVFAFNEASVIQSS